MAAKYNMALGDIIYAHSVQNIEGYERIGNPPSSQNVIHVLVFVRAAMVGNLQCYSTADNPSSNYMKVTIKNTTSSWKIFVCGFYFFF